VSTTSVHGWLVRRLTYPLWQRHRRGTVLSTLAQLERSQWLPASAMEALQLSRLQSLVAHASTRSPFYRESFARAGLTPQSLRSLADLRRFPVVEKADLRDRGAELLNGADARRLTKRQTSGSTGIPVVVWVEPEAEDAWTAAMFRNMQWWKVGVGDRRLTLISRHDLTQGRWLKQYCIANVVEYSAMDLTEASLARVYRWLARGGVRVLTGYPSSLTYLAQYAMAQVGRGPFALETIVTTGEVLHDDQRALLGQAFDCPVVNEYGSSETGPIAAECPDGRMHIAAENVIVESEDSAAAGLGDLLLTDLTNYAMPLIRYRIGDLGAFGPPCSCGRGLPVLRLLAGRTADLVILPGGRRADFGILSGVFDELREQGIPLRQYRVVQHAVDHFEVLLAGSNQLGAAEDLVRRRIVAALQAPVNVAVRTVGDIPPDATGKRRRLISHVAGARAPFQKRV